MPIRGLEYETNEWDGLGRAAGPSKLPVRTEPTATRTATTAAAPTTATKTPEQTVIVNAPVSAGPGKVTGYQFLGIDITDLVVGWNNLMDKLGFESAKLALGQRYKTNQWDGTIRDLERGKR